MKRLIAYSSVSHLGFSILDFRLTPTAWPQRPQQINHESHRPLFLIVRAYERVTPHDSGFGGWRRPCEFCAIYLIVSLSSLGMPLLNGFHRRVHDLAKVLFK